MNARTNTMELAGAAMVLSLLAVAILAPHLAPHDPARAVASTFGDPGAPSAAFPLGTDELGRDVLSRIIFGARGRGRGLSASRSALPPASSAVP